MKTVINLSPVERIEEGIYNVLIVGSIAGFVSSMLLSLYIYLAHQYLSYVFISITLISVASGVFTFYLKFRRFGKKNHSLAERIVKIEGVLGEHVPGEN